MRFDRWSFLSVVGNIRQIWICFNMRFGDCSFLSVVGNILQMVVFYNMKIRVGGICQLLETSDRYGFIVI
jgi:hypothetical protein